ncbi:hypothetical protein C8J57DRAFT_1261743 [Mycena rebaudengoi]|nr:hypothetical protein C8J57DRAFT_1261743 [Mycena rebaudengoi]
MLNKEKSRVGTKSSDSDYHLQKNRSGRSTRLEGEVSRQFRVYDGASEIGRTTEWGTRIRQEQGRVQAVRNDEVGSAISKIPLQFPDKSTVFFPIEAVALEVVDVGQVGGSDGVGGQGDPFSAGAHGEKPTERKRWKKSGVSAQAVPIFPQYWRRLVTKKSTAEASYLGMIQEKEKQMFLSILSTYIVEYFEALSWSRRTEWKWLVRIQYDFIQFQVLRITHHA